jgi:hypothetical protein
MTSREILSRFDAYIASCEALLAETTSPSAIRMLSRDLRSAKADRKRAACSVAGRLTLPSFAR